MSYVVEVHKNKQLIERELYLYFEDANIAFEQYEDRNRNNPFVKVTLKPLSQQESK